MSQDLSPAYPRSRDYAALWQAAKRHSIVCIVHGPDGWSGVGVTSFFREENWMSVGTRGLVYMYASSPEEFASAAAEFNLEWIPPLAEAVAWRPALAIDLRGLPYAAMRREIGRLGTTLPYPSGGTKILVRSLEFSLAEGES